MNKLLDQFIESSALYGGNASFIEDLYEQFLQKPESVGEAWREKFNSLQNGAPYNLEIPHSAVRDRFEKLGRIPTKRQFSMQGEFTEEIMQKQASVARLINQYRVSGHQQAANDPLKLSHKPPVPDLDPAYYGLTELDLDMVFDTCTLYGSERATLREILAMLDETYCGSIGFEYTHIVDIGIISWIINRIEGSRGRLEVDDERKIELLKQLTAAEGIEKYLHRKYVGQKRFSLEGGECLIPLVDELIQRSGEQGVKEVILGMAHRGRLNVLINILGKSPSILFDEFEGRHYSSSLENGSGDVKYHLGYSSDLETPGGAVHLALAFNPSHLEIINPVVEGSVRARQDRRGESGETEVLPFLIHGDAAFAGQGVVMETLNMAETNAYTTGGTIHIVVNNQIGFTMSNPFDARSTLYCTDVANMIQAPVFHVNGDDPEAVLLVTQMAVDYRMEFQNDVVIDLICYRRHGHNEADEPAVTQPMMYKKIRKHPTTPKIYAEKLIQEGVITSEQAKGMEQDYSATLDRGESVSRPILKNVVNQNAVRWNHYMGNDWDIPCDTTVSLERIRKLTEKLIELPPGFELHSRVAKLLDNRRKMTAGALPIDWGYAENLAYATLLTEGENVRFSGQDVGRGTFFHRHAILHNQINGDTYVPLQHLSDDQGKFFVYDSLLSEEGVLAFEYGYSTAEPDTLVVWEAQFGDFANGAQVVIDQFISSGESKWGRLCGLTMLLPHGYEGQGPEHSSARLERYLQLSAEHNIQICTPTTPAQIFHLLRRQLLRPYRKPLIVMSPKSLLRHNLAVSTLEDFSQGGFQTLIGEIDDIDPKQVGRVVLCAGKIFYDLLETRRAEELDNISIMRVEQVYPFPLELLTEQLKRYPNLKEVVWCQEEPQNQGAWYQIRHRFLDIIRKPIKLGYAGRPMSASPAVGQFSVHIEQQRSIVESALYGGEFR